MYGINFFYKNKIELEIKKIKIKNNLICKLSNRKIFF